MSKLLTPPQRTESVRGFLWWRKARVGFRGRILNPEQAEACGISMFRAMAGEYPKRRGIEAISGLIVGEAGPAFRAYEAFTREAESHGDVAGWLLGEVPCFTIGFETPDGQIIRSYDYETVGGKREMACTRPMDGEEAEAAKERVKAGLQRMISDAEGGGGRDFYP